MEVAVSALRAELKSWIERARQGEEVIITDRGLPVARLSGIGAADLVQGLVRDGLLTPAQVERPVHEPPVAVTPPGNGARAAVSGLVRRIRR
ncbi:prevent-host-death family protein [Xylanimonas cellulosilytica DSM 15894]|uniref:Prevent-host-death family protein n=1 Tax=Xylanimonas cellulosilytica (strain DSM 15894 / JCM 12276 / CECT 5975 / KCTC 9989 / LMG 20990 / NBRC 107835 / XIL07) TaxID=446471 RepID=D1BZQ4_XYLCX|nr:type II toxin-antitoxin system prevent-host-death family antitoxin [Xylanimonas cellulosilytica]ACZ32032.1 prevent-host-death family protein [Xylanimonas cellulosilytica DSM 15894]